MTWNIASKIVHRVVTIDENHTVLDAATLMAEEFVGSALITSSSKITGVFTERDLMMRVVGKKRDPEKVKIKDVMTKTMVTVGPKDTASYCLNLMKEHRCRHLLVFDGEEFIGIVSLRDMVALLMEEKEALIAYLHPYISSGRPGRTVPQQERVRGLCRQRPEATGLCVFRNVFRLLRRIPVEADPDAPLGVSWEVGRP